MYRVRGSCTVIPLTGAVTRGGAPTAYAKISGLILSTSAPKPFASLDDWVWSRTGSNTRPERVGICQSLCHPHVVEVVHLGHRAVVVCHDCESDSGFLRERKAEAVAAAHRSGLVGDGGPALRPAA